jgi:mono/diheme cytochrome c family protein
VSRARLTVLAALVAACGADERRRGYEYMPDMARSLPYDTYAPNPVLPGGLTLQAPVRGTVSRGSRPLRYGPGAEEAARAGRELTSPVAGDVDALAEGRALYEAFCLVCHGARGDGDGPLVPKIPNPPAYTSNRVRAMAPGQLVHVMTFGSSRMPAYASQLSLDDRWKLAAYVGTLQRAGEPGR